MGVRLAVWLLVLALSALACGSGGSPLPPDPGDWEAVREAAAGQTVRWWMFGGDAEVNRYVDEVVAPAARERGVMLERVPVDDTAAAVQRVVAERRGGRDRSGSVDLIWINGENFAAGKRAGLWFEDWATRLPNAALVDWSDPTIATDFGVSVEAQESPWSRAVFVFVYDRRRTPDPPRSWPELLAYARRNPGRVTYPAPPDFTGSAFVRQAVQALGEDEAFDLLRRLKPLQWRGGGTFPEDEAELNDLFGNGEVDLAMSYDPTVAHGAVRRGQFPPSARPLVFESGALRNTSYVTIPANASSVAGALVVADLLLEPDLQILKADPDRVGLPTVLDPGRLAPRDRRRLEEVVADSPYLLRDHAPALAELPPERVQALERRWRREVLE